MRFNFKNLGFIDQGSLELGELTVICGPNNSGKTYVSNAINGILLELSSFKDFVLDDNIGAKLRTDGVLNLNLEEQCAHLEEYTRAISTKFTESLSSFFNDSVGLFDDSEVELLPDDLVFDLKKEFKDVITIGEHSSISFYKAENSSNLEIIYSQQSDIIPAVSDVSLENYIKKGLNKSLIAPLAHRTVPLTSERISISLLQNQVDNIFAAIQEVHQRDGSKQALELIDMLKVSYVLPLSYDLALIRNYEYYSKQQSFLAKDPRYKGVIDAIYDLMQGECVCKNGEIFFIPKPEKGRKQVMVPIHLASSAVKSLLLLDRYIRSLAAPNDLLIIDEPEQNLYIPNQRKMGSLIARLINAGINVLLTTHSVENLTELDNRIMLSGPVLNKEKLMDYEGISVEEILRQDQVKAYMVRDNHALEQAEVNKFGMQLSDLENEVMKTNNCNDDIIYSVPD